MNDYIELYETMNNQIELSNNTKLTRYWNQTKEAVFNNLTDYSYDSYCDLVINQLIDDEKNGEIGGHNLLALIKMGLPYYAAI